MCMLDEFGEYTKDVYPSHPSFIMNSEASVPLGHKFIIVATHVVSHNFNLRLCSAIFLSKNKIMQGARAFLKQSTPSSKCKGETKN